MSIISKLDFDLDFDLAEHNLDIMVAEAFAVSLEKHISYVQEAGRKIGVEEFQLQIHDNSKWTEAEFPGYAKRFHGDGAPDEFAAAWLHHIHHNPHHWHHWVFPYGYTPKGSTVEKGALEMPANFVLEMVADWMGSEYDHTGNWDMKDWLWQNIPKIRVHSNTAECLRHLLDAQGYADVVWVRKFAHEGKDGDGA